MWNHEIQNQHGVDNRRNGLTLRFKRRSPSQTRFQRRLLLDTMSSEISIKSNFGEGQASVSNPLIRERPHGQMRSPRVDRGSLQTLGLPIVSTSRKLSKLGVI